MIISKNKGKKFSQSLYDDLFKNIENDLRELGFGDVSVNKKMKDLNKILYDILLKIEDNRLDKSKFRVNNDLIFKYFSELNDQKNPSFVELALYFEKFYNFCFDLPLDSMIDKSIEFKL